MNTLEEARHDWEEDQRDLAGMREYDPAEFRSWAYAGCVGDNPHLVCPACGCTRSGDRDIPNTRTEVCSVGLGECPCHEGEV
jgi:hypothetical protein